MPCAFKSCPLAMNGNGGLQREHQEFSFSATKNIISLLPQWPWPPLNRVVTYHEGLPLIKPNDTFITWSCKITRQTKIIITALFEWLWPSNFAGS